MRLFDGDRLEGEICPECVLTGPAGAAGKIRGRFGAMCGKDPSSRGRRGGASLERMLSRRARLLEGTPSFSLAARQAAVRETRERR